MNLLGTKRYEITYKYEKASEITLALRYHNINEDALVLSQLCSEMRAV